MPITRSRYIAQFAIHSNNITDGTVTLADLATIYTDNIVEATNIYFTNTRVQNYLTNISGNLVPAGNALYDLGSESSYWRDLYLSGNSLYLGNILIRDESGTVTFTNTVSQTSISVGGATSLTRYIYTAANNQSVFTGPDANNRSLYLLDPGLALVYLNGTLLTQNSDYTAYTTNVTIAEGLQANDVVSVLVGGTVDTQTSLVSSKRYTYNTASLTTVVSGADSLGQTLDLSYPEKTHVFVNGILMMPTTDYTAYASNITFTSSILAGSTVIVIDNLSQVTSNVVNSINGLQGQITLTTSNVTEGTNLYFSNARVSNAFVSSGTANAVLYLNAGNVVTSGSALTFDGTNLGLGGSPNVAGYKLQVLGSTGVVGIQFTRTGAAPGNWSIAAGGAANTLQFYDQASNSERLRIDSSGNVGIGTTSPSAKLDVSGNAAISGTVTLSGGTANGVLYLNGSKVATTGSALTFDGSTFWVAASSLSSDSLNVNGFRFGSGTFKQQFSAGFDFQQYYTAAGQASPQASILVDTAAWGVKITGTEQMRLTSTGLGLGTSSPAARLHVSNGSGCQLYVGLSNNIYEQAYDHIWQTLSGAATKMTLDSSGNLGLGVAPSAWGGLTKNLEGGSGSLNFYSTSQLWLTQNAFWDGAWKYKNNGNATSFQQYSGQHVWFTAPSGTAGNAITFTQAMTLNASGNLGLGTTSPYSRLGISGDITLGLGPAPNGSYGKLSWRYGNSSSFGAAGYIDVLQVTAGNSGHMVFATNNNSPDTAEPTERVRITSSGNLCIGTTIQNDLLNLNGGIAFVKGISSGDPVQIKSAYLNTTYCQSAIRFLNPSNGYDSAITFHTQPSNSTTTMYERVRINGDGDLLVNTTSTLSSAHQTIACTAGSGSKIPLALQVGVTSDGYTCVSFRNQAGVQGAIGVNISSVSYNTTSDYRLKNTIAPMTGALAKVQQLKPVTYKWNADGSDGEGFIAHELAEVCPQAVTGEKDAVDAEGNPVYQGVDTSFLVATLTAAIQEQQAMINELKADLALLKNSST